MTYELPLNPVTSEEIENVTGRRPAALFLPLRVLQNSQNSPEFCSPEFLTTAPSTIRLFCDSRNARRSLECLP